MIHDSLHLSIQQLRQSAPVVHCITNYVAMDLTANALLAIGARPLMSAAIPEMQGIAHRADALLLNIGTLDDSLLQAALIAGQTMYEMGKPVVLDPVGIQISSYRMQSAMQIIKTCHPCVIKGNTHEMQVLPSSVSPSPTQVLVTTGATDYITDGARQEQLSGGSPLMTQVTAMGCTAGTMIAAFATIETDPFTAAVQAMQLMKQAGQEAITDKGLGTYRQQFIDCLSRYA